MIRRKRTRFGRIRPLDVDGVDGVDGWTGWTGVDGGGRGRVDGDRRDVICPPNDKIPANSFQPHQSVSHGRLNPATTRSASALAATQMSTNTLFVNRSSVPASFRIAGCFLLRLL